MLRHDRTATRWNLHLFATVALLGAVLNLSALPLAAQEVIEGKAILAHPAGKHTTQTLRLILRRPA